MAITITCADCGTKSINSGLEAVKAATAGCPDCGDKVTFDGLKGERPKRPGR